MISFDYGVRRKAVKREPKFPDLIDILRVLPIYTEENPVSYLYECLPNDVPSVQRKVTTIKKEKFFFNEKIDSSFHTEAEALGVRIWKDKWQARK